MRALLLIALLAACSFNHSSPVDDVDAAIDSLPIDAPPVVSQIEAGPIVTGTIYYVSVGQLGYTVPANASLLLVSLSTSYAGTTAQAVRLGTADLTSVGSVNAPSQDGRVEIWMLSAPPAGVGVLSIVVNNTSSAIVIGVMSFTGTDPAVPHGAFTTAIGTIGPPSLSVPSPNGELAFGVMMWNGTYTKLVADPMQSSHWNLGTSDVTGAGSSKPGSGTTLLRWTVNNDYDDHWAVGGISLKPLIQ